MKVWLRIGTLGMVSAIMAGSLIMYSMQTILRKGQMIKVFGACRNTLYKRLVNNHGDDVKRVGPVI